MSLLTKRKLECVIFCGHSALEITKCILQIYSKYRDVDVIVVAPSIIVQELQLYSCELEAKFVCDEEIAGYKEVKEFLWGYKEQLALIGRSPGWYLQQFLKLAYSWKGSSEIFIQDGDTFFSPNLLSQLYETPAILTTDENVVIYNVGQKCMGLPFYPLSFIANGGIFYPEILKTLGPNCVEWFKRSIYVSVLENQKPNSSDFSEYQIMGSLLYSKLPRKSLKIFRRFDLVCKLDDVLDLFQEVNTGLKKYDAIAIESRHASSFIKRLLAKVLYKFGYSW